MTAYCIIAYSAWERPERHYATTERGRDSIIFALREQQYAHEVEELPDACASCGEAWKLEPDTSAPAWAQSATVDRPTAEYPYCRACHYSGAALEHQRARQFAPFADVPELAFSVLHTGGGCMVLHVDRANRPSPGYDGVTDAGEFVPYVWATVAYEHDGEWHIDAGLPDDGEAWGAYAYLTQEAAENGDMDAMPGIVPTDIAGIIAFALEHLPVVAS